MHYQAPKFLSQLCTLCVCTQKRFLDIFSVNAISAGQLLCGGLFSADSLSTWFAAVALLHSIVNNVAQKEQLLRVQLATSLGNPPVSLLQQCTNILAQVECFHFDLHFRFSFRIIAKLIYLTQTAQG